MLLTVLMSGFNSAFASEQAGLVFKVSNVKTSGVLNVRQQPSASSKVILQLPADARWIIKRTSIKKGSWQKVVWGVKEGWVSDNYLKTDLKGTEVLTKHRQCVMSNPQNSLCCGFNKPSRGRGSSHIIKTYRVIKVAQGQSLNVRESGNANAKKLASIPHNAVGIVKFPGQQVRSGGSVWEKIRWNGRNGWVNSSYLAYDPILSDYRNIVQQVCSAP